MSSERYRSPKISIIIPALNEEQSLPATIASCHNSPDTEILIVDGGSTDATRTVARESGALLLTSEQGRGIQLNCGARQARSPILLFLHADTVLPPDFERDVITTLSSPEITLGAFKLRTDLDRFSMRIVERIVNIRSRFLHMPYGDQALFIKRQDFFSLGGFAEIPLMEDFEFVRRVKKHGKVALVNNHVLTSGRRWRDLGIWRTTFSNQITVLRYLLGVSPESLASSYRESKRKPQKRGKRQ